jgi:hypothetical protein
MCHFEDMSDEEFHLNDPSIIAKMYGSMTMADHDISRERYSCSVHVSRISFRDGEEKSKS